MTQKGHAYPASGAWMLDNFIRRWLQPPSELVEKLAISTEDVVVDFGCGPGYYTAELSKRAKLLVDVDISPEMLQKAQAKAVKAGAKNVQFLQSDEKNIQISDGSADKILLVTVYHEIGESETALKEFGRILKHDGKLIIVEVVKKGIFPGAPVQNPETLKKEIEAGGFKLQQMQPYKGYGMFFFIKTGKV
jgi:ubiquinone/menaquinone biosynthesis C-methylase UbiE